MSGNPSEDSELGSLMTRSQRADPAAVDELVRGVSPALLRYFRALGAGGRTGQEDAEDLLQECWIKIHRSRHTYRESEPVMPWVYAIARHTRLDAYRKQRRMEAREVLVASVPEGLHRSAPEAEQEMGEIEDLIADLPESQRE